MNIEVQFSDPNGNGDSTEKPSTEEIGSTESAEGSQGTAKEKEEQMEDGWGGNDAPTNTW